MFKIESSFVLNNPSVLYKYKEQNLLNIISKLEVLNPLNTLKRGYSITKINNKVVEIILLKKGFNSGKDLSNSLVKRTANLLLSLINCSLVLQSDFNE